MGRAPCCDKANVKRGPWSPDEDTTLKNYLEKHGTGGNWIALPQKAGLKRCGKSCRLRWLNYLRPDIKHGGFTDEEDNIICSLFKNIGSRWSVIASHLPGRTDNDVKNYWNTKLKKKLLAAKTNFTTNNMNANNNQIHLTPSLLPGSKTGYENHSFSNYFNKSCITTPMDFTPKQNVGSSTNPIQFPLHHHGVLMEPSSEFGVSANNNPSSSVSSSQEISSLSVPSTLALDNGNISWWSGTVGDEYDRLLMDFGLGSSYDLLNGYSLDHERINEVAAPNQANSLYGNFFANTSDIKSEVMYQSITN